MLNAEPPVDCLYFTKATSMASSRLRIYKTNKQFYWFTVQQVAGFNLIASSKPHTNIIFIRPWGIHATRLHVIT